MTRLTVGLLALSLIAPAFADGPATTQSATTQATTQAATSPTTRVAATRRAATTTTAPARATVSADAQPVLQKLAAVYTAPGPWRFTAEMTGLFDVAGRSKTYGLKIDGRTDGDGRFRHDADPAGLLVSDGDDAFLYDRRRDAYAELSAGAGRQAAADINPSFIGVLVDENPALLLTLTTEPAELLRGVAKSITLASAATTRPAESTATVGLVLEQEERTQVLWLNDAGEIVATTIDYAPLMKARGAAAIKSARVTLVYRGVTRDAAPADAFAWRPPATALQFDVEEERLKPTSRPAATPARGAR